jgi:hypothetical protein
MPLAASSARPESVGISRAAGGPASTTAAAATGTLHAKPDAENAMTRLPVSSQSKPTVLTLALGDFVWTQLREEAERQQVPVEELAAYAITYYLADADRGRISWPVPRIPSGS